MDVITTESDCIIDRRDAESGAAAAILCDDEGGTLFEFPPDWTDEDVKCALRFANKFFAKGVKLGSQRKVAEFKAVMDI